MRISAGRVPVDLRVKVVASAVTVAVVVVIQRFRQIVSGRVLVIAPTAVMQTEDSLRIVSEHYGISRRQKTHL